MDILVSVLVPCTQGMPYDAISLFHEIFRVNWIWDCFLTGCFAIVGTPLCGAGERLPRNEIKHRKQFFKDKEFSENIKQPGCIDTK